MITVIFEITGILTFLLIDYVLIRHLFSGKKVNINTAKFNIPKIDFKVNYQLILIILFTAFIIMTPWIFTSNAISSRFNFTATGGIGDTINGIAGPFIAWMGAVLVYLAFKEQVKANKNLKNQNDFNLVLQNLNKLEENTFDINKLCQNATTDLNAKKYDSQDLKRVSEIIRDFANMTYVIDSVTKNQNVLKTKIYMIWDNIYKSEIETLNKTIVTLSLFSGLSFLIGTPLIFNQEYLKIDKKIDNYT